VHHWCTINHGSETMQVVCGTNTFSSLFTHLIIIYDNNQQIRLQSGISSMLETKT